MFMKQVVEILNRKTLLRLKNNQLKLYDSLEGTEYASISIEDIEVLILSNRESVYSHQILVSLSEKIFLLFFVIINSIQFLPYPLFVETHWPHREPSYK